MFEEPERLHPSELDMIDLRRVMASGIVTLGGFGAVCFVLHVLELLCHISLEPPLGVVMILVAVCWVVVWWRTDPS